MTHPILEKKMDKELKLTPWFPADVKPVHVGIYNTTIPFSDSYDLDRYQYWNGRRWGVFAYIASSAKANAAVYSAFQDVKWRGLAVKP